MRLTEPAGRPPYTALVVFNRTGGSFMIRCIVAVAVAGLLAAVQPAAADSIAPRAADAATTTAPSSPLPAKDYVLVGFGCG